LTKAKTGRSGCSANFSAKKASVCGSKTLVAKLFQMSTIQEYSDAFAQLFYKSRLVCGARLYGFGISSYYHNNSAAHISA
jgi:hypothetical protein